MPAYLSADIPGGFEQVRRDADAMTARVKSHSVAYDETMAQALIDAAVNYPWVHPQVTASVVLSGNPQLMDAVARHAATRMAQAGLTWAQRSQLQKQYDRDSTRNAQVLEGWLDG